MARTRRFVGLLSLLALIALGVAMCGVELPTPGRPNAAGRGTPNQPLAGVRAVASTLLLRVGNGAPAGGELAFLAIEPSGNLIVSDRVRHSVLRFDAAGHLLAEWGPRLGDTMLAEPAGVAASGDAISVLDRGTPRLFRLDANGRPLGAFSLEQYGPYGLNGLATDSQGNLYAADTGRNRILVLSPTGALLRQFGRGGSGLGDFTQPMGLAFLPDGGVVVADWENSRLERFDNNFEATDAWSVGFHPWGVAADADGRVYAPDAERRRVLVYTPRGDALGELGGQGSVSLDVAPRQVAIGPAQPRSLYVLGNEGVLRLDLDNTAPPPQGGGEVDVVSPMVIALLLALPVAALLLRRGRRRAELVAAPAHGEVGLQTKNGAQRQQQQPGGNQNLVVADQADGERQPAHENNQPERDRQSRHRT